MRFVRTVLSATLALSSAAAVNAQQELTGDEGLACQAILCLATGSPPSECAPALSRFYGISYRWWSDTLQGRINFLNQCPIASQDSAMRNLVNAMAHGAGRCDAISLNNTLLGWTGSGGRNRNERSYIINTLPDYCSSYANHPYTDIKGQTPRYVGDPLRGGFWSSPANYSQDLATYNARIAAEDLALAQRGGGGRH